MKTKKVSVPLKIVCQSLVIIIFACTVALFGNVIRKDGIPIILRPSDISGREEKSNSISLAEAKEMLDTGMGFFIDSRSEEAYHQGHIFNALNLPEEKFEDIFEEVKSLIPDNAEFTLIVYCGGEECESSTKLARKLKDYGYVNVRVFFGGWNEWNKAGYPTEGTPE